MQNETQQPGRAVEDLTKKARELGRDLKDQASNLTESATAAVKTQASSMTESAREMASDAGEKMKAAVADQKNAGADYVGNVAEMVRRASYEFDGQLPQAGHYIRKTAAQMHIVSDALRTRDIPALVGEVQDFARKQPAAFFGAAVLAGFAAVRFFKSAPEALAAPVSTGAASAGSSSGGSFGSPSGGSFSGSTTYGSSTAGR